MIIGFDASRAFISNRSGTENYSYQLLINLARLDQTNNYHIFLRPPTTLESAKATFSWPSNFKLILLPYPRFWTQFGLAKQTFIDPLDVLFIPAHTVPLIRKPGLKTVMTVHDLGAEFLPQAHQVKQRLYLKMMTDFQLKSATHLIAVSKSTKKDIIQKVGVPEKNISVIYEGYNQELFKAKPDRDNTILKQFELEKNNYFLFVGTIQPRKNLVRVIEAYAIFLGVTGASVRGDAEESSQASTAYSPKANEDAPETPKRQDPSHIVPQLVLVGSKGWLSDEIYELPKKLGIQNKVKLLGYVPDEKLPVLYSNALAFVFPSLYEGFGLPILEAFASSCPVLTSNTSSLPEVAGKAALLVNPESVEEIAHGMEKIMDQKLRTKLIQEGKKQLQKFSWEKCARETLKILENA
ncbi:MAG: glycosyltransferase family 1 protein [Candidatus Daviesbacteria bacterium]